MNDPFVPSDAPPPSVLPTWNPLVVLFLVLMSTFVWRFLVECSLGIVVVTLALVNGADIQSFAEHPEALMRTDVIAVGTGVQLIGMVFVIAGCLRLASWDLPESFATRSPRWSLMGIAAVSGGIVGFFPSWINGKLAELMPEGQLALQEQIAEALTGGPILGRALMIGAVVLIAPLFEELAFRGGLWAAMERSALVLLGGSEQRRQAARVLAFIGTSLAFAAFHIDPVHVISLLPTAFLLGWLRLTSRSVWPGVAAHFVNNGLAAILVQLADDPSASLPLWIALTSLMTTLMFCGAAWALRDQESA